MPDSRRRNFALVVKRALAAPFSITTLTAGFLWLLLFYRSDLGVVGPVLAFLGTGAYILAKLQDESFIRDAIRREMHRGRRSALRKREFQIEELGVESRIKMKNIVKLQREIAYDVVNSPVDEVAAGLSDTVDLTDHLIDRALEMANKRRDLVRYLNKTDDNAIRSRIQGLETRLAEETDDPLKSELQVALNAKRQELEDYTAIEESAARIITQLDGIECSFASLKARLVRIKSTDIAEWTAANQELKTELGGLNTAVDALEESINEALSNSAG